MKILVADESHSDLKRIEAILSDAGYQSITVEEADGALEALLKGGPPIALLNWTMPEMSGIEIVKRLRSSPEVKQYVYTIIVTGRDSQQSLMEAIEAGVDDFIVKPFEDDELLMRVKVAHRFMKTHQRLVMLERNAAVTEMGASLKHAIFNPLTAIMGATELLWMSDSLGEGAKSKIDIIYHNAKRIEELVRKLERAQKAKSVKVVDSLKMLDLASLEHLE